MQSAPTLVNKMSSCPHFQRRALSCADMLPQPLLPSRQIEGPEVVRCLLVAGIAPGIAAEFEPGCPTQLHPRWPLPSPSTGGSAGGASVLVGRAAHSSAALGSPLLLPVLVWSSLFLCDRNGDGTSTLSHWASLYSEDNFPH